MSRANFRPVIGATDTANFSQTAQISQQGRNASLDRQVDATSRAGQLAAQNTQARLQEQQNMLTMQQMDIESQKALTELALRTMNAKEAMLQHREEMELAKEKLIQEARLADEDLDLRREGMKLEGAIAGAKLDQSQEDLDLRRENLDLQREGMRIGEEQFDENVGQRILDRASATELKEMDIEAAADRVEQNFRNQIASLRLEHEMTKDPGLLEQIEALQAQQQPYNEMVESAQKGELDPLQLISDSTLYPIITENKDSFAMMNMFAQIEGTDKWWRNDTYSRNQIRQIIDDHLIAFSDPLKERVMELYQNTGGMSPKEIADQKDRFLKLALGLGMEQTSRQKIGEIIDSQGNRTVTNIPQSNARPNARPNVPITPTPEPEFVRRYNEGYRGY